MSAVCRATGTGVVQASRPATDSLLRIAAGVDVHLGNGPAYFQADEMDLAGTITAPAQTVVLRPNSAGKAVRLGATGDTVVNTLELSAAELDHVTASAVRIGGSNVASLAISAAISPANTSTLHLISGGAVSQSAAFAVTNLAVEAGGSVNLSWGNSVDTAAIRTTTGDVLYMDANSVTVGEVDGVAGISTGLGVLNLAALDGDVNIERSVSVTGTAVVQASRPATDSLLRIAAGVDVHLGNGPAYFQADEMDLVGTITAPAQTVVLRPNAAGKAVRFGATGDTVVNTLELSAAELDHVTPGVLRIGGSNVASLAISAVISPANTSTLHLISGGAVSQSAAITVPKLAMEAGGNLALGMWTNDVDVVAAYTSAGFISFGDLDGFTVGTVDGVSGLTTNSGSVNLASRGNLTIDNTPALNDVAGTGSVSMMIDNVEGMLTLASGANVYSPGGTHYYVANKMNLAGTIQAGEQPVVLRPLQNTQLVDLGSVTDTAFMTLELSDAELDRVMAAEVQIGMDTSSSPITISQPIDLTNTGVLRLITGGDVLQTAGITVAQLAVTADGLVELNGNNDVDVVAIREGKPAAPGGVSFWDFDGFEVGEVAGVTGIVSDNGPVMLHAQTGDVTVARSVGATSLLSIMLAGSDALLTIAGDARVQSLGGPHTYTADKMDIRGEIAATGQALTLQPSRTGAGMFALSGTVDAGALIITDGVLRLEAPDRVVDSAALNLGPSVVAQFDLHGFHETIGSLSGTGQVSLGSGTLTVNLSGAALFDGLISGAGSLEKSGAGVLTLSAAQGYTGTTLVEGLGTLYLRAPHLLASSSSVVVGSEATLAFEGTAANDVIGVTYGGGIGVVEVLLNGISQDTFIVNGKLQAFPLEGDDEFQISATGIGGLHVEGQAGADDYHVYFGDLDGPVTIADTGSTGTDRLFIEGTAHADYIVKTANEVSWGNPSEETVHYEGMERIRVSGNAGKDTIIDPGTETEIFGGPDEDDIIITSTLPGTVYIDGEEGADRVTVMCGALQGDVTVTDSSSDAQEMNMLTILGTSEPDVLMVTDSQVTRQGASPEMISYAPSAASRIQLVVNGQEENDTVIIESVSSSGVVVDGGDGADSHQISLGNLHGMVTVLDSGGAGNDAVHLLGTAGDDNIVMTGIQLTSSGETVRFETPLAHLELATGEGDDSIFVEALGLGVDELALDGGAGSDQFTLVNLGSTLVESLTIDGGTGTGNDHVEFQGELPPNTTTEHMSPTVNAGPDGSIIMGGRFTGSGSFSDPDLDNWSATVDYGDGSGVQPLALTGNTFIFEHTYANVGAFTVVVTVSDDSGGIGVDTLLVGVHYAFSGFLAPLSNGLSFAIGRTIPVKFRLTDADGNFVNDPSAVTGIDFAAGESTTTTTANPTGNTSWRYDATDNQYIFNWQTKGQVTTFGDYRLVVSLKDGTEQMIGVRFAANNAAAKLTADGQGTAERAGRSLAGRRPGLLGGRYRRPTRYRGTDAGP